MDPNQKTNETPEQNSTTPSAAEGDFEHPEVNINSSAEPTTASKSLLVAYLCWLTGGLFGLHHLYLGRDDHAFITFATCGGYFFMGLIRDLWRLPEYVKDANNEPAYLEWLQAQMRAHEQPPQSYVRQLGMMIMGNVFAYLVEYAIPSELMSDLAVTISKHLLVPFGSALGVWTVANVGRHQGSLSKPVMAAYFAASFSVIFIYNFKPLGSIATIAALGVSRHYRKWRMIPKRPKSMIWRLSVYSFCTGLYCFLLFSSLYFSCTLEDPETEKPIKCRDALSNFMSSSAYLKLSEALWQLVEHARHQGFSGLWREVMQEFDLSGRSQALATLGLSEGATTKEIVAAYKKLSREFHPDKERDESKKLDKHEKFIQVQEAYGKLKSRDD